MRTKPFTSRKNPASCFIFSFSLLILSILFLLLFSFNGYAATSSTSSSKSAPASSSSSSTTTKTVSTVAPASASASTALAMGGGDSTGGGSGTVLPDLFTGTLSYSIPIEVAPGRKGMVPSLALEYRSTGGNGWLGVGWDLEVGAIERSTKNGVNYSGDEFVLRIGGSTIDLVHIYTNEFGNTVDEYRAKIESGFSRIRKLSSANGTYWEVTDRGGTKYRYGYTSASRQDDPGNSSRIYKWCLDYIEDTNGNYMNISYDKTPFNNPYDGEIYLKQIDYTGNYVHFYLESRTDAPVMYTTNFGVKTAYRLMTIEVRGNGYPVRAYKLIYDTDTNTSGAQYSSSTGRSLLTSVQQFGKDANVDTATGNITNETVASKLPPITLFWTGGDGVLGPCARHEFMIPKSEKTG